MATEWKHEVTLKVNGELTKQLAHSPGVVARITELATKIAAMANAGHTGGKSSVVVRKAQEKKERSLGHAEADFGVIVQNWPNSKHARAFALPTNNGGIHLELTQSLLLKAIASVAGQ